MEAASSSSAHKETTDIKLMKGWQLTRYDGIDALDFSPNLKVPQITSPDQILVEVHTTSLNPLDLVMLGGVGANVLNIFRYYYGTKEFPLILGRDFCGVVKEKGDSVHELQIGDKVWGVVPPHFSGSHAEYIVIEQKYVTKKPEALNDYEAAGILYVGLTVWSSLYTFGRIAGSEGANTSNGGGEGLRICILGASGGVGTIAVQIAKAEKMIITATCSTDSIEMVRNLGADHVIDYARDNLDEIFRDKTYDVIFDCAGLGQDYATRFPWKFGQYITLTFPLLYDLHTYGLIFGALKSVFSITHNNVKSLFYKRALLKWGFFRPDRNGIEYLKKLVDNGQLKAVIDSRYKFSQMRDAYEKLAHGHLRGKIIVKIK